jgi:pectinesterase
MQHRLFFLIMTIAELSLVFTADKKITIFIIGDSTAANKDTSGGKQERGWGQMFQSNFNENFVVVDNHAVNGRSTKSFLDEGRWDVVKKLIKKGDYVMIQFGHNDAKDEEARHTDPGTTFDANLKKYATETSKLGGIPILMSPVVRRKWKNGALVDTHGDYRLRAKIVADSLKVHYIDGNAITEKLEKNLGEEGSKRLHLIFAPGEQAAYPAGIEDNTHYNVYGATIVAKLFAEALVKEVPDLSKYLKQ